MLKNSSDTIVYLLYFYDLLMENSGQPEQEPTFRVKIRFLVMVCPHVSFKQPVCLFVFSSG